MKGGVLSVAIIGAAGAEGRELADTLQERQFPFSECLLLDEPMRSDSGEDAELEDIGDIEDIAAADLKTVDLAFFCGRPQLAIDWVPRVLEAGGRVIDCSGAFAERYDVPIVVPEVNADVVLEDSRATMFASPLPSAIALAVCLKPLDEAATLLRVVVAGYESVSRAGRAGIEELSRQTRDLMSGRSVEAVVFPQRIAFNLIPQIGTVLGDGVASGERQAETQVRRLLDLPELPISVTSVLVPTFHGEGYAINAQTERPLDVATARAVLRQAPGVLLMDEPQSGSYPTLADAMDQEAMLVGRVREDLSVPYGVNLWAVIDGLRKGAAVNAVQIAELLLRR
jgi:aspartate-semialdehyde dehydrogenase